LMGSESRQPSAAGTTASQRRLSVTVRVLVNGRLAGGAGQRQGGGEREGEGPAGPWVHPRPRALPHSTPPTLHTTSQSGRWSSGRAIPTENIPPKKPSRNASERRIPSVSREPSRSS